MASDDLEDAVDEVLMLLQDLEVFQEDAGSVLGVALGRICEKANSSDPINSCLIAYSNTLMENRDFENPTN